MGEGSRSARKAGRDVADVGIVLGAVAETDADGRGGQGGEAVRCPAVETERVPYRPDAEPAASVAATRLAGRMSVQFSSTYARHS